MCPFERWLGFCPFTLLKRMGTVLFGRHQRADGVSVHWGKGR